VVGEDAPPTGSVSISLFDDWVPRSRSPSITRKGHGKTFIDYVVITFHLHYSRLVCSVALSYKSRCDNRVRTMLPRLFALAARTFKAFSS
jgi:hypothetical protein